MLVLVSGGAVAVGLLAGGSLLRRELPAARIAISPGRILADGYDSAVLTIESDTAKAPRVSFSDSAHGVAVEKLTGSGGQWRARIRAGVVPGRISVRVETSGHRAAFAQLELGLDARDSAGDGTPDFLRLDSGHDRQEFRRWFTYLAESQYFLPEAARPAEINDCAALIRFAYREALHAHDSAWSGSANLPVIPAFDSVEKYQYPFTPLGSALFRVRPGVFDAADVSNGSFLQFADARTLWRFNTHPVSRNLGRAQPGDLLFYRQETDHVTFHSMIYLGESQLRRDGRRYVLYHTGRDGANPGEIRRLTVEELLQFPQPEWRPLGSNSNFLGVARWNILRTGSEDSDAREN